MVDLNPRDERRAACILKVSEAGSSEGRPGPKAASPDPVAWPPGPASAWWPLATTTLPARGHCSHKGKLHSFSDLPLFPSHQCIHEAMGGCCLFLGNGFQNTKLIAFFTFCVLITELYLSSFSPSCVFQPNSAPPQGPQGLP